MIKLINRKSKQSLTLDTDTLVAALLVSIEKLLDEIADLKADLEDLTDFVEDNLD